MTFEQSSMNAHDKPRPVLQFSYSKTFGLERNPDFFYQVLFKMILEHAFCYTTFVYTMFRQEKI